MTDWKQHDGGPQPVADDVWICIDAMPEEMEEVGAGYARLPKQVGSWKHVTGFFVLNQHLIDAARLEGIRLGLEAAVEEADYFDESVGAGLRIAKRRLLAETIATIAKEAQHD